jgi:hypothetical protein
MQFTQRNNMGILLHMSSGTEHQLTKEVEGAEINSSWT